MADTKRIRFAKPWGLYNAGETAGFSAQQADHLVGCGVAVHESDAEKEPAANASADVDQRAASKDRAEATSGGSKKRRSRKKAAATE